MSIESVALTTDVSIRPGAQITNDHERTDADLIRQCLMKDNQAWAALLERYSGLVYSIARRSNLGQEDAADVFQSVCLILLEGMGNLQDVTKLSSWLTTVTQRQCYRVKQRQLRLPMQLSGLEAEITHLADQSPGPDDAVERLEEGQLVQQALSMMDEPSRQLLTYLFYEKESWSYQAIAQRLGWATSTIGPKRGRCLKELRGILSGLGFPA